MNERIKELALQANGFFHLRWDGREGSVEFQAENLEKFAKLIVRECINEIHVADVDNLKGKGYYLDKVAEHLEKHFEVEE